MADPHHFTEFNRRRRAAFRDLDQDGNRPLIDFQTQPSAPALTPLSQSEQLLFKHQEQVERDRENDLLVALRLPLQGSSSAEE